MKKGNTYLFKQSVSIRPKGHPAKTYLRGVHELTEAVEYDPYFLKLVGLGLVEESEARPASTKSAKERADALLEKLVKKIDGKAAEKKAPEQVPSTESSSSAGTAAEEKPEGEDEPKKKKPKEKNS